MSLLVEGFKVGLLDFFMMWVCAFLASLHFKPAEFYRWVWFVGFVILFILFTLAWLNDLGAHL